MSGGVVGLEGALAPVRLGMVGGGDGAFIGPVHRMAAALDGRFVLCAGAFSSTPERSVASGRRLGLAPERCYAGWREMLAGEMGRAPDERVEVVSIVTPNATHFEIASSFAGAGFHVVCDKPLVNTSDEAAALEVAVGRGGGLFAVMYNYTGYPMVREAAARVRRGDLGAVRKVFVEYHQGWLAGPVERGEGEEGAGRKQAAWRQDGAAAGAGGAIGDIGTHAENLVGFVTGLEIESLCAELTSFVPGRILDDDGVVLLRFRGGARGVLTVSQVCIGEGNGLSIRVHGERGSLAWRQERPEALVSAAEDGSLSTLVRGGAGVGDAARLASRLPAGHPEGFIEAMANVYGAVAEAVAARREGMRRDAGFPTIAEGARGVRFIERAVESARAGGVWTAF